MTSRRRNEVLLDRKRLLAEAARAWAQAREEFFAFRQYMRPDAVWNWWTQEVALELQQFYGDFAAGKRPKLVLMAPPQHGKSTTVEDFIAWVADKNPNLKTIYASYSEPLGVTRNLNLQRMFTSPRYRFVFGNTRVGMPGWVCKNDFIEFEGNAGSFRNTTVSGAVNGMELHLGVIDDPVKGRAEAQSLLVRDRTWSWFTDDFLSRFATDSAMLMIMTRWHVDDLFGRYIERNPDVKLLRYPAIAEVDEEFRAKGEALFEELKPLDFLLERKGKLTIGSWESLYQQNPIVIGGGILPIEKLTVLNVFDRTQIKKSVRYWDKAGTAGGDGAYTAGVLMHAMHNGTFVIAHVARGRWGALDREQQIKACAQRDQDCLKIGSYEIIVEQEPGSGGKESAEATIRNLGGFTVYPDKVTGSKEVRAEPFAAQVQAGNVFLVAGDWVPAFREEAECFPNGKFKDQIDAASGAFARLTAGPAYDHTYAGWQ
jgi:predicted phage terminase large subunit-like protein